MFDKIKKYISHEIDPLLKKPLLSVNSKVVVGLSGGSDSVFLLYFFKSLQLKGKIDVAAAHLNHEWRQTASRDENFCKKLCLNLKIPFISRKASELRPNFKFNGSKEEAGRRMRLHFFAEVKRDICADYIALAHHAQDQQETFFIRLIRGTSLSGLTCMSPVQGCFLRPLLEVRKESIIEYLQKNQLNFTTDETNDSDEFLRNRIRKYIVNPIKKVDTRFNKKFQSTLSHLKKEDLALQSLAEKTFKKVFEFKCEQFVGQKENFFSAQSIIQKRVLMLWLCREKIDFSPSDGFLEEIIRFLSSERGGSHKICCDCIIIKKKSSFKIEKTGK